MAKNTPKTDRASRPAKKRVVFPWPRRCDLSRPNAQALHEYPDNHAWLNHASGSVNGSCIACNRCFSPSGGFNPPLGA